MLHLIAYPPAFGAPSASPFCVKAICFLNMAGATWEQKSTADPRKAPKSKLPVLMDGDAEVPDSESIRAYLERKFAVDFDEGLSVEARATSRAVIRMCDEHLYFALVCERWLNDENWAVVREEFFGMIPKFVRGFVTAKIRKQVQGSMNGQGMGRHTVAERLARVDMDIKAILTLLGDKPFLFGDQPTAVDASAAPVLAAMAGNPADSLLRTRVRGDAPLMAYLGRVKEALYP